MTWYEIEDRSVALASIHACLTGIAGALTDILTSAEYFAATSLPCEERIALANHIGTASLEIRRAIGALDDMRAKETEPCQR